MTWKISSNLQNLIDRLDARIKAAQPDSDKMRQALTRIGINISSQAKINVRGDNLIDTGRLLNSIRYEFFTEKNIPGVRIGSFGVPYAAVHEFGYNGVMKIRQHTRRTKSGSTTVKAHERFRRVRESAYLRRAVRKHRNLVVDVLREALQDA